MLVVDASAIFGALVLRPAHRSLIERLRGDGDLHAPHLIDIEYLNALRKFLLRRELRQDQADDARREFGELALVRYPHQPLADRMWELRQNVSIYDAAYLALGEALGVPLITLDARLARAPGLQAAVEVF